MNLKMSIAQCAVIVLAAPGMAFAALGDDVSTLQSDRMQMKASAPVARHAASYTVHEMKTPSGTTVREYVTAGGSVFAVSWNGPTIPDLRQLMGNHFDTYVAASKNSHAGHTHLSIRQEDFVMRSSGHTRAFSGMAYVPGMLPEGVKEEELN